jgi:hypothetical protein
MSRCILPSQLTTAVVKTAMTSTLQTTFSPGSLFGFSPHEDHSAAVRHLDVMISLWSLTVASTKWLLESAVCDQLPDVVDRHASWQKALDRVRSFEARRSCHQAVLSLKHDKVTCKRLRHLTSIGTLLQRSRRRLLQSASTKLHARRLRSPRASMQPSAVFVRNVTYVRLLLMPSWPRSSTVRSSTTTRHTQ